MLYPELSLPENAGFLQTKEWKLFIMLKSLCEYFLAPKLIDHQVNMQTELLHQYLSVRLSLITENEPTAISPKHVFSTHYDKVIRSVGCLAHCHTNSGECKNAQHKRRITLGKALDRLLGWI